MSLLINYFSYLVFSFYLPGGSTIHPKIVARARAQWRCGPDRRAIGGLVVAESRSPSATRIPVVVNGAVVWKEDPGWAADSGVK